MSSSRTDTAPGTWDDARDARFFGITARLFSPAFCAGATVLLASYDDEPGARPDDLAPSVPLRARSAAPVQRARRAAA